MSILEADHARIVAEATAEARAAERRHWEARFRNAEAAHAAALAAARAEGFESAHNEWAKALPEHLRVDRLLRAPRTLTAGDPEPAVVSVLLDGNGRAWQRTYVHAWCTYGVGGWTDWESMLRLFAPFTLIHDGGAA